MKYVVNQESGAMTVQNILDSLKNNISAEFRKHNSMFRKQYNDIWNKLPMETKALLVDDGSLGIALHQSLNKNGRALKRGLQYMKDLGEFSSRGSNPFSRNSIDSILNPFDDLPF